MINRIFSSVNSRIGKVLFAICCILFWIIIADMVVGKGFFGDIFWAIDRQFHSEKSKHIAVVEFDYSSRRRGGDCDNRVAVFKVVDKLLAAGSKVVILDFNFAENVNEKIVYRPIYSKRLVFGSSIYKNGFAVVEKKYPNGLFTKKEAVDVLNSGHLLLNDSLDAYPTARAIQHILTSNYTADDSDVHPSLSLVSYNLGENSIDAERLRQEIKKSQDNDPYFDVIYPQSSSFFIEDGVFKLGTRISYPKLPTFFPIYSADLLLAEDLPPEVFTNDFNGKYVFVSSTWDLGVDRFAYGVAPLAEIVTRGLARMGVVSHPIKNMVPGVYVHASALANMLGDGYTMPRELVMSWLWGLPLVAFIIWSMHKLNILPRCLVLFSQIGEWLLRRFVKKRHDYHIEEGALWWAIALLIVVGAVSLFFVMALLWVADDVFWEPTEFFLMYVAGVGVLVLVGDIEDLDRMEDGEQKGDR